MVVARLNPFLLGNPIFKGYLSFREGILPAKTEEPIDSSSLAWSSFLSSSRSRRRMYGLKRSAYLNVSTTTNVLWRLKWIHPLAKVRNHELQLEIPIEPLPSFQRESWNQNGWMSIPFDTPRSRFHRWTDQGSPTQQCQDMPLAPQPKPNQTTP